MAIILFSIMFGNKLLKLHRKNIGHLYVSTTKNELISDRKEFMFTCYHSYSISYAVSGLGVTKFVDTKFVLKTLTLNSSI